MSGLCLRKIRNISVDGSKNFVANDDVKKHLKYANVGSTGLNFNRFFLNNFEEYVDDATIVVQSLEQPSLDATIIAQLAGYHPEIYLAQLFELLKRQYKGGDGALATNNVFNVAYILGSDKNSWAVHALWLSGGDCWYLGATSIKDQSKWRDGCRIFCQES